MKASVVCFLLLVIFAGIASAEYRLGCTVLETRYNYPWAPFSMPNPANQCPTGYWVYMGYTWSEGGSRQYYNRYNCANNTPNLSWQETVPNSGCVECYETTQTWVSCSANGWTTSAGSASKVGNEMCTNAGIPVPQDKIVCGSDPAHCNDGIHNDGTEEGRDCGDECTATCVPSCPPGSVLFDGTNGPDRCVREYQPDNYGNCASLDHYYYPPQGNWVNGFCSEVFDPFLSKEPEELPPLNDPFSKQTYAESEKNSTLVNNPDGTSTLTTTETVTKTGPDGKEYTETITNTKTFDANGNLINETNTSSGSGPGAGSDNGDIIAALTGGKPGSIASILKDNHAALSGTIGDGLGTANGHLAGIAAGQDLGNQALASLNANAGITNGKLDGIQDSLVAANSHLAGIKSGIEGIVPGLTEEASEGQSEALRQGLADEGDTALDDMQQAVDDETSAITGDFNPGTFLVPESVTATFKSVVPAPQTCQDLVFTSAAGRTFSITCAGMERTRTVLAWLFALWTVYTLFQIFIDTK